MAKYEREFYPLQPLVSPHDINGFIAPGEVVFFEARTFAPFIKIVGRDGHYSEKDFRPATAEDLVRMAAVQKAAVAADRFFREAMPKMNVKDSFLDANAVDAWNKAEIAVARARARVREKTDG